MPTPAPPADGSAERQTKFSEPFEHVVDPEKQYQAKISTSAGELVAFLYPGKAPKTVNNFVNLARHHYYDGLVFHRVIQGFMIQGGCPEGSGRGGPGYRFEDELPERGQYEIGTLAMANAGPNTNGSQARTGPSVPSRRPERCRTSPAVLDLRQADLGPRHPRRDREDQDRSRRPSCRGRRDPLHLHHRGVKASTATAALGIAAVAAAAVLAERRRSSRIELAVPLGDRTSRTFEVARLGTRAGVDLATTRVRSALASDERRAELQAEFELRTAAEVVASLGNMKGALMKLGQMASYLDQGLPEPVRDALSQLQSDAPPMASALAAQVVRDELGGPPEELFRSWDPLPVAAASIGQVHRAITTDGRSVAVKIQYPGVDDAIRADLETSDVLFAAMGMLFPGLDPKPLVDELRARLIEELDYHNEAGNQRRFVEAFTGHPTIHVPLTTEWADGVDFRTVTGEWSQRERDLAAETIYRYAFGGIYELGIFNGDPHPGNYRFRPGGQVSFLDYGLCKVFTPAEVNQFERLIQAMCIRPDRDEFLRLSTEMGFVSNCIAFSNPLKDFISSHFLLTVTPEYASESVRRYFDLSGPYAEVIRSVNLPPSLVVIQRINLGLFAVLAELGATANWRRLAEEIWPFADGAPSTPMGEAIAAWRAGRGSVPARPGR